MNAIWIAAALALAGPPSSNAVGEVEWHETMSDELQSKLDGAVRRYAALLADAPSGANGSRTMKALGLVSALSRIVELERAVARGSSEESEISIERKKIETALSAALAEEEKAFWPGAAGDANRQAVGIVPSLHGSHNYHLPMILLLLEHHIAGAASPADSSRSTHDREMRFGVTPVESVRKDVVRLLAVLLAEDHNPDGDGTKFDDDAQPGAIWGYHEFGRSVDPCVSPSGLAMVGLSAAVFGLRGLEYDDDDYEIQFNDGEVQPNASPPEKKKLLSKRLLRDRAADVCTHLLLSFGVTPETSKDTKVGEVEVDTSHLDVDAFRAIYATGLGNKTWYRIEASQTPSPGDYSVYGYRGRSHTGGYFNACAAYIVPTASRILSHILDIGRAETTIGRQYVYTPVTAEPGQWTLRATSSPYTGTWTVKTKPDIRPRHVDLTFTPVGSSPRLDLDPVVSRALNGMVACASVADGDTRRLRGYEATNPTDWSPGSNGTAEHRKRFSSLHAFSYYKAATAIGDGRTIGRWPVWEDLANGLLRQGVEKNLYAGGDNEPEKVAALAFAIMTMRRTYRPIFRGARSRRKAVEQSRTLSIRRRSTCNSRRRGDVN